MSITLAELGETELLDRLARFAPAGQLNDDTALLPPDYRALLVNTDVMVEGVHFSAATTAAADVGWRAVVANLSDLAASGSEQVEGITVGLVAPGNTSWCWVEEVYQGISEALERFGGTLLGRPFFCRNAPMQRGARFFWRRSALMQRGARFWIVIFFSC